MRRPFIISTTPEGRVTEERFVSSKALALMICSDDPAGQVNVCKLEHDLKASTPISTTLAGMVIDVR